MPQRSKTLIQRVRLSAITVLAACATACLSVAPSWGQDAAPPTGASPTAASETPTVAPADLPPVSHRGGFETGDFSEFDGGASFLRGAITTTQEQAVDGAWSAKGSLDGSLLNGYSRVAWSVSYEPGQTIRYGASYYLPGPLPCWAMLARWDNYVLFGGSGDVGGVLLENGTLRLAREDYDGANFADLSPRVPVPVGRWFSIEVVQRLGASNAYNEFYVDGTLIGTSTTPNSRGRPIRHIRFGFVGIAPQCTPATSFFIDRVFAT